MKHFKAIAAMSLNRVIGRGNQIPWHLPEDFKWFKSMTKGNIVVMGRMTFESLNKPLPDRRTLVLTRHPQRLIKSQPGRNFREWRSGAYLKRPYQFQAKLERTDTSEILIFNSLRKLNPSEFRTDVFICGGAQIYEQALPLCADLFLTVVKQTVVGDAFFPEFENQFELVGHIKDCAEFEIRHYRNRSLT